MTTDTVLLLSGRTRVDVLLLAFDRSLREVDADGHLRVSESRISKGNICPYFGREIPNWEKLGLDPQRTYKLFRDPKELVSATRTIDGQETKVGAWSFDGKPLLIRHVPVTADLPQRDLWIGSVGTCTWEEPYVMTRPLSVWTQEAIDLIDSLKQRELSSAYRYDAVMEPGSWGGQQYDGRMVNIRGNHVAIVSEGRAGHDVHVADALPLELRRMTRNVTLSATVAAILAPFMGKLSAEEKRGVALGLDAALGEVPAESVLSLDAGEMKACEDEALAEKKAEHGEDAELTEEEREKAYEKAKDRKKAARDKKARDSKKAADAKKAADKKATDERESGMDEREAAMDAAEEETDKDKDDDKAKDRKRARDARKAARDKRAKDRGQDALPDPKDHRRDFRSNAEDSAVTKDELPAILQAHGDGIRKQMKDAAEAREKVRPLVGAVSLAMDSADEIYKFALKHEGVNADGIKETAALGALVDMAIKGKKRSTSDHTAPSMALDSGTASTADFSSIFSPTKAA